MNGSPDVSGILSQLYALRSFEEHFNPWQAAIGLPKGEEAERIGALRAYQSERLAGYVYSVLLTDAGVREHFQDDDTIKRFWNMPPDQRRAIWGVLLNLDVQHEHRWSPNSLRLE